MKPNRETRVSKETDSLGLSLDSGDYKPNGCDCFLWDMSEALERVDGDRAFLTEIVELFLACSDGLVTKLRESLATRNADAVRMAAHALKGSAAELSAREMQQAARRLEETTRKGDFSALDTQGKQLEEAVARVSNALRAWLIR